MEDRKLNEKESLELITQMIRNTRRNLDAGGGNMFLLWGYVGVVVTLGVLAVWYLTGNTVALWGFWALPVVDGRYLGGSGESGGRKGERRTIPTE